MVNESIELQTFDSAVKRFHEIAFKQGYDLPVIKQFDINNRRYKIIELDGIRYLTMFKRDVFKTFGQFFPEDKDKAGESVNRDDLREAVHKENVAALLYLYQNGGIYFVMLKDIYDHWHLRQTNQEFKDTLCFGITRLRPFIEVDKDEIEVIKYGTRFDRRKERD